MTLKCSDCIRQMWCESKNACWREYEDEPPSPAEKHSEGLPRHIDLGTHDLCRFDDGRWSLRFKLELNDVAHVRYLNDFEAQMVDAALALGALDGAAKP